ncbi:Trm112 family protein [Flaviflexus huanghaiensis]|uniref:Trm112 family protein n=1 Tax=Flaviflexus huanghaiensis TaxID=1111473 RepID=UPI0015FC9350|nr:hypothetical protein [Flaviflexus huanghaiensis]
MTDWIRSALRCPKTGTELRREGDWYISSSTPAWRYRIENEVPILLPTEAEEVPA